MQTRSTRDKLNAMEIQQARNDFPKVRQLGDGWCIPACYEALSAHANLASPTQEQIVTEYHKRFGVDGYVHMAKKELHKLSNPTPKDLRPYGFLKGDFTTFTDIANHLLPKECGKTFVHPGDTDKNFENHLNEAITSGLGAIIVICPPKVDCHALLLVGFDGKTVEVYDPQHGGFHKFPLDQFNRDCVRLQSH